MTKRKTYHVTPGTDGGWKVKEEKALRASSSHETKAEAVERVVIWNMEWELGMGPD
jgi:undecaprenyl pyrophosphate synthase